MARAYAIVVGLLLTVGGIAGFVRHDFYGLHFNTAHNLVHLLSGMLGLAAGLLGDSSGAKTCAQVFGVIYTLVALAGLVGRPEALMAMLGQDTTSNLLHLAVGLLGLLAGFPAAKTAAG
ncbi:MAG TPA: DUF4383 domain-containing protein [Candidatus Acidoferrales bacterium]|nr:DUF4383 domain-containing protein [Candidatus Acidoferrales bacterium]